MNKYFLHSRSLTVEWSLACLSSRQTSYHPLTHSQPTGLKGISCINIFFYQVSRSLTSNKFLACLCITHFFQSCLFTFNKFLACLLSRQTLYEASHSFTVSKFFGLLTVDMFSVCSKQTNFLLNLSPRSQSTSF